MNLSKNIRNMNNIKSFAFFDLETTGLPEYEHNKTKITEISIVACSKDHMLNSKKNELPRVLNKLTLCVNPMKLIQLRSTELTGLDNFLLEHENKLDSNAGELIKAFFKQLQKPICLIAHNGNKFDFPILRKHLNNLEISLDDVLCADSLQIFKQIDTDLKKSEKEEENNSSAADVISSEIDEFLSSDLSQSQQNNEHTPSHRKRKIFNNENGKSHTSVYPKPMHSKRQLFPDTKETISNRKTYKLMDIYARLHDGNTPKVVHNAEEDVINLLKCAIATNKDFVRLSESIAINFEDVAPLGK